MEKGMARARYKLFAAPLIRASAKSNIFAARVAYHNYHTTYKNPAGGSYC